MCSHPQRASIDSALTSGQNSIRGIAGRFQIPPESLRRHVAAHVAPAVRAAMAAGSATVEPQTALSLAARILSVAERAHGIALAAEQSGDLRTALAAGHAEVGAVDTLAQRFGLPGATVPQEITDAADILVVMARAAREDPSVAEALAVEALAIDRPDLAEILRERGERGEQLRRERGEQLRKEIAS